MKALSIKQPWAWLIARGYKDIENRQWRTNYRGRILIHAGKAFDNKALAQHRLRGTILSILASNNLKPQDLECGGIVGSVDIVECVNHADSMWFDGKYGFVLKNPEVLPFAPYRGQLGFFNITEAVQ